MASSSSSSSNNAAVRRISQEMKEFADAEAQLDADPNAFATWAEPLEDDIFEWHFALYGAEGTPFEGGIYHGRILLPVDYPFKPPNFMLLTPNGRFETLTKICLSITSYHEEHWQPSWSVRTALTAIRAFMVTPSEGALGGIDFSEEQRREYAEKSRAKEVNFTFGSEKRREVTRLVHEKMLGRMDRAKQAAKKAAMERRERGEREAREREGVATLATNDDAAPVAPATPTSVVARTRIDEQRQPREEEEEERVVEEEEQRRNAPSSPPPPRTTSDTSATTHRSTDATANDANDGRVAVQRPPPPPPRVPVVDHRTSAIKLLDSLSVCLIVAIVAILLKRCMWVPPSL